MILEDIKLLKIKPDVFTYTSDYFDKMLDMCENGMIKQGLAYVDDTDGDKMRLEREQRVESINRNNCKSNQWQISISYFLGCFLKILSKQCICFELFFSSIT